MLTHNSTSFLLANVVFKGKKIKKIYYDDLQKQEKKVSKNQCKFCLRQFSRTDAYTKHLRTCRTKLEQELQQFKDHP